MLKKDLKELKKEYAGWGEISDISDNQILIFHEKA